MDQHPIRNQIASLEAQLLALRDSLAALPPDQRGSAAADLERARGVAGELSAVLSRIAGEVNPELPALDPGGNDLVWSAERTTRLYAINTALSVAVSQGQVADVVIGQALPALSAEAGVVLLQGGETLKPIREAGDAQPLSIGPLDVHENTPFGQVARAAQAIWVESPDGLARRFPGWRDAPWAHAGAIAVAPLIAEGRVLGVMAFRFDGPRSFTIADRAFILVLAQQCAAALERVYLYERLRRAAALEERNRLARDLHDSVSQALYAIALSATVGRKNLARDTARVARALDNIEALTGAAQADLRALLFDLRADSVSQTGLVNALEERVRFIRLRHGLAARTELCEEPDLAPRCKEALYGIAREALHNAAKHARATEVVVKLCDSAEGLVLEVLDNGIGFQPGNTASGHYGLQSMRERAAELGAVLRIDAAPGEGTRVAVAVPTAAQTGMGQDPFSC